MRAGNNNFIFSIAGAHGVGKTTIFSILEDKYSKDNTFKFYHERYIVKNPTYPLGSIKKEIAFRGEIFFLQQLIKRNTRLKSYLKKNNNKVVILDRTPICVLIYSKALEMVPKDYKLIYDLYKSIDWVKKEHIIYLHADVNVIMKRIISRGRLSFKEQNKAEIQRKKWHERDYDYLLKVSKYYNEFLLANEKKNKNLSIIDTNYLSPKDVVKNIENIISAITNYLPKKRFEKFKDIKNFL